MLINLSNHPSAAWSGKQRARAAEYGEIIDMPFPEVDPYGDSDYIDGLVDAYFERIARFDHPVVMVQGEFLFTYRMVCRLKAAGIKAVAGCSARRAAEYVDEDGNTRKQSIFEFVDFREY